MGKTLFGIVRNNSCVLLITLMCGLVLSSTSNVFSQSGLCTGKLGSPTIFKDFGAGNAAYNLAPASDFGFSTTFKIWNKPSTNDGFYSIVNAIPNDFGGVWHSGAIDHTTGDVNGHMLLVNGDQNLGEFYRDTATGLCTGSTYEFSSYLANIFRPASLVGTSNPPVVRFEIRDMLGNVLQSISSGSIPVETALTWRKYGISFNAPAPQVILVMVSTAPAGKGNDIVIDDIAFTPCMPLTTNIIPLATVCELGDAKFAVGVQGNADFKYAQWQKSLDKGLTWNYVGTQIIQSVITPNYTLNLPLISVPFSDDSSMFRLIMSTDASYMANPNSSCNVISDTSLLVVNRYPVLKITNPDTVCNVKIDLTLAAITAGSTFPSGTQLTYHTSQANADNGVNALAASSAKAIVNSGTYYVRAATNTTPACADVEAVDVEIEPLKILALTALLPMCKDSAVFTVNATKTNITNLSWVKSSTGVVLQSGVTGSLTVTPTVADLAKDSIWIIVTSTDAVVRCPNVKDSVKAIFYDPPTVQAPADTSFCLSSPSQTLPLKATFNASNGVVWSTSSALVTPNPPTGMSTSLVITGEVDEKIYITARTKGCRPVKDSVQIKTEVIDTIKITGPVKVCRNNPVVDASIKTSSLAGITWQSNGGAFSPDASNLTIVYTPDPIEIAASVVKLKAVTLSKVGQLCPVVADSIKVGVFVEPSLDLPSDTTLCFTSNPTKLNLNSVLSNADSLVWSTNNAIVPIPKQGLSTLLNTTNNSSFKVLGTAYKKGCIPIKDSLLVMMIAPPKITLPEKICLHAPVSISATVTNPPALGKYAWKRGTDTLSEPSNTLLIDTVSTYTYNFSFDGGCFSSDTIVALKPPKLVVPDTAACQNALTAFIAGQITGANYYWGASAVTNGTNKFPINAGSGVSNFKALVIDINGCRDSVLANVNIVPYPNFNLSGADLCPGESKKLTTTLVQPSLASTYTLSYDWKRNGSPVSATDWQELAYNQAGNYSLTLGIKGCTVSNSYLISFSPVPKINIPLTYKHCFETDAPLNLQSNLFAKYVWRSDEGLIDSTQAVHVNPEKDTYYYLNVKNAFGCKDSTTLFVRKVCPPRLFVPNVITPESNDVNAALRIFGANYTNFEITIFSRWGEVIFNSKDPQHAWNGEYVNEKMPIGNYQWLVTYEGDTEEYKGPYKKTGDVAVVR